MLSIPHRTHHGSIFFHNFRGFRFQSFRLCIFGFLVCFTFVTFRPLLLCRWSISTDYNQRLSEGMKGSFMEIFILVCSISPTMHTCTSASVNWLMGRYTECVLCAHYSNCSLTLASSFSNEVMPSDLLFMDISLNLPPKGNICFSLFAYKLWLCI